ncbi:hypothetical protein EV363DRAFT_1445754 [Boletus edulis]|nr:hypothetical protein EV363DRAFT_1445754 [Boletus edulis]
MSSNSHLVAEARSIVAGTEANPSDQPYTAGGTTETTNESRHGQRRSALARILYLFTAILYTTRLAINLVFAVRMVETDDYVFFTYLGIVLASCAASPLETLGLLSRALYHLPFSAGIGYRWSILDALRGMLANGMVIAIFAVAQSLVDIPFRNMVLDISGSEEYAGPVVFSRFCQAISAALQGIPPTVSQWVTGNSGVIAEELKSCFSERYPSDSETKVKTFIICETTW